MEFSAFVFGLCLADTIADIKYEKVTFGTWVVAIGGALNGLIWAYG